MTSELCPERVRITDTHAVRADVIPVVLRLSLSDPLACGLSPAVSESVCLPHHGTLAQAWGQPFPRGRALSGNCVWGPGYEGTCCSRAPRFQSSSARAVTFL